MTTVTFSQLEFVLGIGLALVVGWVIGFVMGVAALASETKKP